MIGSTRIPHMKTKSDLLKVSLKRAEISPTNPSLMYGFKLGFSVMEKEIA
jgi:hypothetical protein